MESVMPPWQAWT